MAKLGSLTKGLVFTTIFSELIVVVSIRSKVWGSPERKYWLIDWLIASDFGSEVLQRKKKNQNQNQNQKKKQEKLGSCKTFVQENYCTVSTREYCS